MFGSVVYFLSDDKKQCLYSAHVFLYKHYLQVIRWLDDIYLNADIN